MKYQYFVCSRWRNKIQVLELVKKLRKIGKTVYSFFESPVVSHRINNDPEEDMRDFEKRDWQNDPYVKEVFDHDMDGLKESDCLIMLLPAGSSAHIEAGAAYGMGKKCILIGTPEKADSLYKIFSDVYSTIDEFIDSIT